MRRDGQPITGMLDLLQALYCDPTFGQKTRAVLYWDRAIGDEHYYVREHFDDGRGHSGAFTHADTLVPNEIAEKARQEYYVEGLLYPGYVAKDEFKLSKRGREEYFRLDAEEKRRTE